MAVERVAVERVAVGMVGAGWAAGVLVPLGTLPLVLLPLFRLPPVLASALSPRVATTAGGMATAVAPPLAPFSVALLPKLLPEPELLPEADSEPCALCLRPAMVASLLYGPATAPGWRIRVSGPLIPRRPP